MADPRRFAIFQQIAGKQMLLCGELDAHQCIAPATISHHLKELHTAGLITWERKGRSMEIALCRPVWQAYLHELSSL